MSKHTPGPWSRATAPGTKIYGGEDGRELIAMVVDRDVSNIEIGPNCDLIAAAPELAEALREVLARIDAAKRDGIKRLYLPLEGPWVDEARAALRKAGVE